MVITTSPLVKTYTLPEFWDLPEPSDHSILRPRFRLGIDQRQPVFHRVFEGKYLDRTKSETLGTAV